MPYLLLSRNPAIATIRDFTTKDRIAVPALKTSLPAVLLEMAAAQEWGIAHFDRLDTLTVACAATKRRMTRSAAARAISTRISSACRCPMTNAPIRRCTG